MTISVLASEADLSWPCAGPEELAEETRCSMRRSLSTKAREIARGRDALFHGTRYRGLILASGFLKFSDVGANCVSFSRSPEVAAFSASLPRDDDEGAGAILIFDRASLKTRYKLECHADQWLRDGQIVNEFQECVYVRDVEIAPHLIGLISTPIANLTPKARAVKRAVELRVALTAGDCSCGMRWKTCSKCKVEKFGKTAVQLERAHPGICAGEVNNGLVP